MIVGKYNIHLHSILVHFTNALYPTAIFFLILSYFYRRDFCLFAYFHVMLLATISVPFSYITGLIEWKRKYRGAKVKLFVNKYRCGLILFILGTICTGWYGYYNNIVLDNSGLRTIFFLCNLAILGLTTYLGYLGGKLVFGGAH